MKGELKDKQDGQVSRVHRSHSRNFILGAAAGVAATLLLVAMWSRYKESYPRSVTNIATPSAAPSTFVEEARQLQKTAMSRVGPEIFVPKDSSKHAALYPWKTNIVTKVFWIGEQLADQSQRSASAGDPSWLKNYGGVDEPQPDKRARYLPVAFTLRQNPFYCGLPYNDITHSRAPRGSAHLKAWME